LVGDRVHGGVARDAFEDRGRPAPHLLVVAIGDAEVFARIAVGGRAEDMPLFAEAEAPGVVVGRAEKLEFGAVAPLTLPSPPRGGEGRVRGLEPEEALVEVVLLAADGALEA